MIELYIVIYLLFFIIYYMIEGLHDGHVILWERAYEKTSDSVNNFFHANKFKFHSNKWHTLDMYEKIMVHIIVSLFLYVMITDIVLVIMATISGLSIRWVVHDMVINRLLKQPLGYVGTTATTDKIIRYIHENYKISQWILKLVPLFISLLLIILFL